MALRDLRAFDAWSAYGQSTDAEWNAVRDWVFGLGMKPYQSPSVPVEDLSAQPRFEVREAVVPNSGGVHIMYRYFYGGVEPVDLMGIDGFRPQDFG